MWALALSLIVVIAFAVALIILYVLARNQQRSAELRAVNAEHTVEKQIATIEGLEKAIERETKARVVLRTQLKNAHQLVLTCNSPEALPDLLNNFFAGDDEAA